MQAGIQQSIAAQLTANSCSRQPVQWPFPVTKSNLSEFVCMSILAAPKQTSR